ncbi:unnamed protein product [Rhizoctonia solani]|uniref:Uncharacterized protein n=1 Tax=Rhizoctonia solani TaxID=456999 RepID=A0A8H3C4L0_9AGAM|nr:unnamed protein product [Rhizoctonia solani]
MHGMPGAYGPSSRSSIPSLNVGISSYITTAGRYKRSLDFEASLEGIRPYFHLREHYEEVAKEIRQLERSGDTTLLEAYKAKRAEFVWAWYQKTVPLVQWAVKQRAEHQAKLNILKEARIEGRLLKLGLELIDVRNCRHWCPQWASLVDTAKPFDEEVNWIEMLPSLFNSVELARKERLRTEAEQHRSDRKRIIKDWLTLLSEQLQHMNITITLCWKEPASNSANAPCAALYLPAFKRWAQSIRIRSLPSMGYMMSNWPQLKNILGQPTSPNLETFRGELENKKRYFMKEFSSWRPNLEAALAKTLPMGTTPTEVQTSEFDLKAFINDGSMTETNTRLSRDLRCLLRADAVFKHKDVPKSVYYPDGFIGWTINELMPTYDIESSRVTIAILNELQRPDASYLEMQAHGRSFLCARCANDSGYLPWEGIVDHYVHEHKQWQEDSGQDATCSEKRHHLVVTHDLNDGKSLIRLV